MSDNPSHRTTAKRLAASVAVLATAGLSLAAGPAQAATTSGGNYCVAYVSGAPSVCYETFTAALDKASGGVLIDGPKSAAAALGDPGFAARVDASNALAERATSTTRSTAAAQNTVISIKYSLINWGGSAQIWVASGGCSTSTNNIDWQVNVMPAGWDNVVTSHRAFANCWVRFYENANYTGASVGYTGTDSYIGAAMDNRTSSLRWS